MEDNITYSNQECVENAVNMFNYIEKITAPYKNVVEIGNKINNLVQTPYSAYSDIICPVYNLTQMISIPEIRKECTLSDEDKQSLNRIICSDKITVNHLDITIHIDNK